VTAYFIKPVRLDAKLDSPTPVCKVGLMYNISNHGRNVSLPLSFSLARSRSQGLPTPVGGHHTIACTPGDKKPEILSATLSTKIRRRNRFSALHEEFGLR
jgi:hypothetical protein